MSILLLKAAWVVAIFRGALKELGGKQIKWRIVERPIFATLGNEHFKSSELLFYSSLTEARNSFSPMPSAILFSGSLQCMSDPFAVLGEADFSEAKIIAIDRLMISQSYQHAVFVQYPDPEIYYDAKYPLWCLSRDSIVNFLNNRGFALIEEFPSESKGIFQWIGMIFMRN
ncbi:MULTISPECIES: hypothetical protein [unclassified Synechococcus]|uniref:hypothetical protein n=1 Tax=unclassified Synechococcus TaxID=2626047 RepID=UPI0012EA20F9|nr:MULTISPECIES: hypothetical protein [unclassified Synechococcus]WFN58689.1 hypothetical protein N4320_12960 [Synechococcus sp. CCFWC 502]